MRLGSERGQTMVEFALVLPIFCLLLFGIAQFGIVFNNYEQLTDAVRVGSRKAAVSRTAACKTCVVTNAVRNSATNLDQNKLAVDPPVSSWAPGSDVKVCAHYPWSISLILVGFKGGNLDVCTTERVE